MPALLAASLRSAARAPPTRINRRPKAARLWSSRNSAMCRHGVALPGFCDVVMLETTHATDEDHESGPPNDRQHKEDKAPHATTVQDSHTTFAIPRRGRPHGSSGVQIAWPMRTRWTRRRRPIGSVSTRPRRTCLPWRSRLERRDDISGRTPHNDRIGRKP